MGVPKNGVVAALACTESLTLNQSRWKTYHRMLEWKETYHRCWSGRRPTMDVGVEGDLPWMLEWKETYRGCWSGRRPTMDVGVEETYHGCWSEGGLPWILEWKEA